ncbi:ParA family protein [Kitasatospora purpeofusca]|uniref:ParA family protein n=1 Tax=Kitasatospora purpeofusca TaxID=67352 RepID=UPI00369D4894
MSSRLDVIKRFSDLTPQEELSGLVAQIRPYLRNVIGVTIGKGGVGKTTLAVNLSYTLAELERQRAESGKEALPILYIEIDSNGNSRLDLNIRGGEFDDNGKSFYEALTDDKPLKVIKDVRPYLDVVPSGSDNANISDQISKLKESHGLSAFLALALLLAQISHLYRWIVIDFSPSDKSNQRLGLSASTHLVSPVMGSDNGVIEGMGTLAQLVAGIRVINPEVKIAAISFMGFKKVQGNGLSDLSILREKFETLLSASKLDTGVIIDPFVRESPYAPLCRNIGMPARELAIAATGELADDEGALIPRPRDENDRLVDRDRSAGLANDYLEVAVQVIQRIRQRNAVLEGAS